MSKIISVKPRKGLKVFNPEVKLFLEDDKVSKVSSSSYWKRLIKCGDVELVKEEKKDQKESKKIINKDQGDK